MELKDFVSMCLSQIAEGIKEGGDFAIQESIKFDVPLNAPGKRLTVASGDTHTAGLPRLTFGVKPPVKLKTK